MRLKRGRSIRRGVAGIIATVILFAMMFTVGAGYFLFINNQNQLYSQSLASRGSSIQSGIQENLQLGTSIPGKILSLKISNVGGISVNVSALVITGTTGAVLGAYTSSSSGSLSPKLPIFLTAGQTSPVLSSGITYTAGSTYTFRVLTQRGDVFTATYPPSSTTLAAQAISSGAIGDLYLNFHSYNYYDLYTSGCPAAGSQLGTTGNYSSGLCLGTQDSAFIVPHSDASKMAFSVQVTDLNNQSYDIVMDQFSLLYQVLQGPNAKGTYYAWYIVSVANYNGQEVVRQKYDPYILSYNNPTTIYFVGTNCITAYSGPTSRTCQSLSSSLAQTSSCNQLGNACTSAGGYVSTVFIISHGWEIYPPVVVGSLTYASPAPPGTFSPNYGQNSPYVSSLYN